MKIFTYLNRRALSVSLLLILFYSFANGQQVARGLTASNGQYVGFWEYTPVDYALNPTERYPIIIFLHGIGERGNGTSELGSVLGQGIPKYIANGETMRFFWNGRWETFLVLSPQLSRSYGDWQNFYVDEMLNYARNNLRIDPNRIYLTGLSLGGGGVWKYASTSLANAQTFAAIAPVCGTCNMLGACNISNANLPVWAFHAQDDGVVGAGCTTSSVQAINNCNPVVRPLMTIYSDGGHFIWDRAMNTGHGYHDPNLYEWFLGQSKAFSPTNAAPIANAGPDINITIPTINTVLNASASSDPDGNIVRYSWRKLAGPNYGTLENVNAAVTNLTGLVMQGTYVFELTVIDNRAASRKDTVQVVVNPGLPGANIPPIAVAGSDQTITVDNINLTSWGSSDADGVISSYLWTKISGPATYNMPYNMYATCGILGMVSGVYRFELQVTDNRGGIGRDTVQITVALPGPPANQPPNANAGSDITITLPTNNTTLNGAASSDPDGTISSYAWTRISGPTQHTIANSASATTGLSNLVQGTYGFQLAVTDNSGLVDYDTVMVTVNAAPPANQVPVARAGVDISITLPVNSTTLDGSWSSDPDGTINSFSWSRISGPTQFTLANANVAITGLSNLAQGTYAFRLFVTDNNGATASDTVLVVVNAAIPPPNQAPVARAGNDITITLPTSNTTLDGSWSSDPDGTINSFSWSRISGPTQFTIANSSAATTGLSNLVQGTYAFRLVVTDNNGATASDTVQVIVNAAPPPPNQAPVSVAGPDISITLPTNSTTLNGTGSYDPDGTIATWAWAYISGPAQYTIANANASSTGLGNLVQGTYSFRLTVTDNNGAINADTVLVVVSNAPPPPNVVPVANAGTDIIITLPVNNTTLNGNASIDTDGSIVSYNWVKLAGPAQYTIGNADAATTALTNLVQGVYSFRLVVTDNSGAIDSDTVQVTVNAAPPPPNQGPAANAGADIVITLPVNNTTLDGSWSSDPDGSISSYSWSRIGGPTQYTIANNAAASTGLSNLVQGVYSFRLTVTDNAGATDSDTVLVTVNAAIPPPNQAPVANAGNDIVITLPTNNTTLNGSASIDPDGNITSYSWSYVSGPAQHTIANSAAASTALTNLVAGTYSFRLMVTDNSGATDSDTVIVTVNAAPIPPNQAPIANAGVDFTVTLPNPSIYLVGTASSDPDGSIVSYSWSRISGPGAITIVNSTTALPTVVGAQEGVYVFELTVTDDRGATATDRVTVTVNAAPLPPNQAPVANAGRDTTISSPSTTAFLNGSASYDPDGSITAYAWKQIGGPAPAQILLPGSAASLVNNLQPGDYQFELRVTDNSNAVRFDTVNVSVVNNFVYQEKLTLYPNPSVSFVNIRCISDSIGQAKLTIFDMNGVIVETQMFTKTQAIYEKQIIISQLKAGTYYLEIMINARKRMIAKFIKQ